MKEHIVMVIFSMTVTFFAVLMLVAVGLFFFEVQNVNNFRQIVNYQIERNGGLTSESLEAIETHSESFFGGRFRVKSNQMNKRVEFGEVVNYTVEAKFPIPFFGLPDVEMAFSGTAVSQVR